jgi:hypothetical protein
MGALLSVESDRRLADVVSGSMYHRRVPTARGVRASAAPWWDLRQTRGFRDARETGREEFTRYAEGITHDAGSLGLSRRRAFSNVYASPGGRLAVGTVLALHARQIVDVGRWTMERTGWNSASMAPGNGIQTLESDHVLTDRRRIVGMATPVRTLSQTKVWPGQRPGHDVTLSRRIIVLHSLDPDFDGAQALEVDCSECLAGTGAHRGHNVNTHARGDKTFVAYQGITRTVATERGPGQTLLEGIWWCTGGTGRFSGITGQGTYRGQLTPAGPACTFEGEYELSGAGRELAR